MLANVAALGAKACVVGVVGNDAAGERLSATFERNQCTPSNDYLVVDQDRPSTTKTRIIAHNQLVVRADREKRSPVNGKVEKRIIERLETGPSETRMHL